MKRTVLVLVASLAFVLAASTANAGSEDIQKGQTEKIVLSSKVPFAFYGFISAEGIYSDSQISTFGTLDNTPASYNRVPCGFNRVVDETTDTKNDAFISGTPQNTRFGFSLDPYDFGGKNFKVDAKLEMDFVSTTTLNIGSFAPRIRRAFAAIGQERWRVLFGQEWDVFSPLNTATLNIGSNLWTQGNLGFRRPQITFLYNHPVCDKCSIEAVASVNLPSNSVSFTDNGNTTGMPLMVGRIGFLRDMTAGKLKAYVAGAYARHRNAVAGAYTINNWGVSASLEAPFHKFFQPSLEFQYGYSLGMMLSIASDTTRQRDISGWGQVKSLWLDWFETNVGYGADFLKGSQVAAGWVKSNQMGFFNAIFKPLSAFNIGLEYNYMRTNYQGNGASSANVAFINTLFFF
jgi:hypothetical protein